jgi:hypothetical protein
MSSTMILALFVVALAVLACAAATMVGLPT